MWPTPPRTLTYLSPSFSFPNVAAAAAPFVRSPSFPSPPSSPARIHYPSTPWGLHGTASGARSGRALRRAQPMSAGAEGGEAHECEHGGVAECRRVRMQVTSSRSFPSLFFCVISLPQELLLSQIDSPSSKPTNSLQAASSSRP
jgi:hypothetical protein